MTAFGLIALSAVFLWLRDPVEPASTDGDKTAALLFDTVVSQSRAADFDPVSGPWSLMLPEDHGGHDDARSESWTILAHLRSGDGQPVGMQFSLTRLGLVPETARGDGTMGDRALYRAHVIVSNTGSGRLDAEERFSRDLGAAGHDPQRGEVWLDDWLYTFGSEPASFGLRLHLRKADIPIALTLTMRKPAAATGPGQGVRGYAIPRLDVAGTIGTEAVEGVASLTHLWGDIPMPGGATANDIFALHLSDGSDLSFVRTVRRDGGGPAALDGAISGPGGIARGLESARYAVAPSNDWPEAVEGWQIRGPDLSLDAVPLLEADHLDFAFSFASSLLQITGTIAGQTVEGLGTLQRTGYEQSR